MLGLILVYPEVNAEGQAVAPDRDFLGAPVLARSLIAAIPAKTEVKVVVAVADKFRDRVQADVIRRFGFIEVAKLLPWTGHLADVLTQSLKIFGPDCKQVMLHDGRRPLLSQDHVKKLLQATDESGAAVSVREHASDQVVLDDAGHPHSAPQPTLQVLHPQALSVERLNKVLQDAENLTDDLNLLPLLENSSLVAVHADPDNLRIVDERDLSRAVEVWSRRAVEFPFLWPRPERFDAQQRELEAAAQAAEQEAESDQEESRDEAHKEPESDLANGRETDDEAQQAEASSPSDDAQDPPDEQEHVEADSPAALNDQEEVVTAEATNRGDSMNAMLSGDNAAASTPLEAAFADMDQDEADEEENDLGTSDAQE